MSLLARLCALVFVALLPALGVQLYQLYDLRRVAEERTRDTALRLAQFAAGEVDQIVAGAHALLEVLARLPAVLSLDGAACAGLVAAVNAAEPGVAVVGAFDREGRLFCSSRSPLPEANAADRAYFREALEGGRFIVGESVVSRVDGERYLPLAVPFPGPDGRPAGAVVAGISPGWLMEHLRRRALPPGGSLSVIDRGGTYLVRWPGTDLVNQPIRPGFRWMLDAPGASTVRAEGPDGVERISGYVPPAQGNGLLVTVALSTAEALGPTEAPLRRGLVLIAASTLLALAGVLAAGNVFVRRPAGRLLAAAGRWTAGDYAARAGLAGRRSEFGRLGGAFDAMAAAVGEREAERDRAEAAHRAGEERLRVVIESATDYAIVTLDLEGRITGWNPGAERVLGHAEAAIVGRPVDVLFTPEDRAAGVPAAELREALARGRGGDDRWMLRADGRRFWASGAAMPLRDGGPEARGFLKILRDETPRHEAEAALKRLNETLEQRVAEAVHERRRAEAAAVQAQKMEVVGQLTGGVAHDFNNLLTAAGGSLDLASRHVAPEGRSHLDNVGQALDRGAKLVRQLMAFSRQETLRAEVVDANELLRGMADLLERSVRADIRLAVEPDGEPCYVEVDQVQLEVAVLNLVVNARDAMPGGGLVRVATRRLPPAGNGQAAATPGRVAIEVVDEGAGMPPAVAARAFEPFFTTKEAGKGTGLGLSMVYGFARQSGGAAEIESRPGQGTTVRLLLPLVPAPVPAAPAPETPEDNAPARADATVLLVEDDLLVLLANREGLADMGYRVLEAEDGPAALEILDAEPGIDVVVSDVVMPRGMSGVELAREIRRRRPGARIVLTSGYSPEHLRGEGAEVDAFLPKPFDLAALARAIDRLVPHPVAELDPGNAPPVPGRVAQS